MVGPEYCRGKAKRALDIAIASGALPATSPVWATMYLYNRIRKQPLLFYQERIGECGQPFIAQDKIVLARLDELT